MTGRRKIVAGLLTGLALIAGWWALVPKIGTATEAEVRAHVLPELLQPLPHPEGGSERFAALRPYIEQLPKRPVGRGRNWIPPDLANPLVRGAVDVLRQGALDRTSLAPAPGLQGGSVIVTSQKVYFVQLARYLTNGASRAADKQDWTRVAEHMEAACLLLDRLFESDAKISDRSWTMPVERVIYQSTLALAARGDLPVKIAERLSAALVVDRHGSASMLQILRGEMQLVLLERIGTAQLVQYGYQAGTYDPLETAELLSARFVAMAHDAGLPASRWSADYPRFSPAFAGQARRFSSYAEYRRWGWQLRWPVQRIRANTARNSIGRYAAQTYPQTDRYQDYADYADRQPMTRVLHARTLQDQVAAALAVVRFRHHAGREPRDFAELVAAGLLRTVPMDHTLDRPVPFDLRALFMSSQARAN